jgi:hypothetical protein
MSEEHTFRSEVNGSLPLSGHRSSVVQDENLVTIVKCEVAKKDFETLQLGAFATPGLLVARGPYVLTAESGFNEPLSLTVAWS